MKCSHFLLICEQCKLGLHVIHTFMNKQNNFVSKLVQLSTELKYYYYNWTCVHPRVASDNLTVEWCNVTLNHVFYSNITLHYNSCYTLNFFFRSHEGCDTKLPSFLKLFPFQSWSPWFLLWQIHHRQMFCF